MKHIVIVTNTDKDPGLSLSRKIKNYIEEKGGTATLIKRNSREGGAIDLSEHEEAECVLVLGGDGTMIRAARDLHRNDLPLIGLNMGHLGYLCELEESDALEAIDVILAGKYVIEERMLLSGDAILGGEVLPIHNALNDVVLYRSGQAQIVSLRLIVDGNLLTTYNCDGLLVATPTGSTAYNMSAGGPIVDPKASMIVITPINPQALSQRSIVLDSNAKIEIEVLRRNAAIEDPCISVAFDGDSVVSLKPGDRVRIQKAGFPMRILKLSQTSFVETLRKKMNNYQ